MILPFSPKPDCTYKTLHHSPYRSRWPGLDVMPAVRRAPRATVGKAGMFVGHCLNEASRCLRGAVSLPDARLDEVDADNSTPCRHHVKARPLAF